MAIAKYLDRFEKRVNALADALSQTGSLRSTMKGIKTGEEARHLIPVQALKESSVVQDAVSAGFNFNDGLVNGFVLGKNHGPHLDYNEHILKKLKKWEDTHPGYTPEEAKAFVEDLAKTAKDAIKRDGGLTTDF